ncbi:phosphatase PAP2 family protein [Luteimonas sp. A537]
MFEAEPILWLQQFSAPWFDAIMRFMSWVGEAWFYVPAILVLLFGIRLRPGMGVLLALLLVAFATEGFKQGFGLPRPSEVDARVLYEGEGGRHLVADGAAEGFWGLPSDEAISAKRATHDPGFGFVSGHTSSALVFALALALFFRARAAWIWGLVVAWPLLMGLSRMYLGRHFLADVLGGLAVGMLGAALAWALMGRLQTPGARAWRSWAIALAAMCALAAAAWAVPWIDPGMAGEIVGTLLCIGALMRFGWPDDATGLVKRAGRVACALVVGYGVIWLFEAAYEAGGWPERHAAAFFFAAAGFVAILLGTVLLARWLGLYLPSRPSS